MLKGNLFRSSTILAAVMLMVSGLMWGPLSSAGASVKTTTGHGTTISTATSRASAACVSSANSALSKFEKPLKYPTPAVLPNPKRLKSKLLYYIPVELNAAFFPPFDSGLAKAVSFAHGRMITFNGEVSAITENQGMLQAIARKASAILLQAVSPSLIQTNLKTALSKGIKVVDGSNGTFSDPLNGLYAHITPNLAQIGMVEADEALVATNCQLTAGIVTESNYPYAVDITTGVAAQITKLCPSCSVFSADVNAATFATDTGPAVSSLMVAHPTVNAIIAPNDQLIDYIAPELSSLGDSQAVKTFGSNAEPANMTGVENGTQAGDVFYGSIVYSGLEMAYQAYRATLGLRSTAAALPVEAVTASDVNKVQAEIKSTSFIASFRTALTK